jgi:carbohydrate diacid regulator
VYALPGDVRCSLASRMLDTEGNCLLDAEMLHTAEAFLESGLNLSETARRLYVHRNTLIYRLDKIQKTIGLDLRDFHGAMVFRVLSMASNRQREEDKI